ncbi:catechol 2,3-dioxygenase-like lactoylglutathione lyase family enzyme [Arthrobacter silviterrae]|uniref:VOC family protein n=1 Tax=Arthrobacter silviterrae TaxID=2026658 RepID=A0ABX0DAZ5_9MICC|nr:VOC family protein [Arthrobacter silviterrae]MDQ0276704.1 catechol 2,3-dioxygenase-like lactoylglutathione lyase family enzyme [Arthrobacter silviterrae]NGN84087.1 VOC family protein [Arthrobacter silviterrae]
MKITLLSIFVDNQDAALAFYTEKLGFLPASDIPMGEHRWLTVVSPEAPDGTQIVLEPSEHPAVKPFRDAIVADGIPFTSFGVKDVQAEYDRLLALGVTFTQPPMVQGPVTTAVLDDTVGNLIQIAAMGGA